MRAPIAVTAAALAASLIAGPTASAQIFNRRPAAPAPAAPAPADPAVKRAQDLPTPAPGSTLNGRTTLSDGQEAPAPATAEELKPTVPLPTGPIEPYMLTRENGPFMVLAYTFKGPEAPRQALALVLELRNNNKLPAYILLPRKFPGKSMIRGVPPTTPAFVSRDDVGFPEIVRTLDEAAVLVGDMKTVKDAADLLKQVQKIHPVCLDGLPQMWQHRKGQGLKRAIRTANPLVPAEALFPNVQQDVLIGKMNAGPHNVRNCPGTYSLQVASFNGRSTFDPDHDFRFKGALAALKSPLATAADDAEHMAEALAKDKDIQKTGFQPYVFHDRFSSRVLIGSFNTISDPAAQQLHDKLNQIAVDLNNRKVTATMICPATELTDLTPIKKQLQGPSASQLRAN